MGQDRRPHQRDVVCKITPAAPGVTEELQSPRFAPELSCCWQDGRCQGRPARSVRRNALGPELRCCLQDCAAAVCGPGTSAAGGCARRPQGVFRGIASSNRDGGRATSDDCPGTPRDTPDRRRSFPGGSRSGAFAGGSGCSERPRYRDRSKFHDAGFYRGASSPAENQQPHRAAISTLSFMRMNSSREPLLSSSSPQPIISKYQSISG